MGMLAARDAVLESVIKIGGDPARRGRSRLRPGLAVGAFHPGLQTFVPPERQKHKALTHYADRFLNGSKCKKRRSVRSALIRLRLRCGVKRC